LTFIFYFRINKQEQVSYYPALFLPFEAPGVCQVRRGLFSLITEGGLIYAWRKKNIPQDTHVACCDYF
jgi:hypothetical protein